MSDQYDYTEEHKKKHNLRETRSAANVSNFPAKLHFMLNDLKRDGLEYLASWQQHGRCFIVRKPKEFERRDKDGYYHEHFLRGKEELALMIQRTKIKGTGPRKPDSKESPAPSFYEMPFLHEVSKNNTNHYSGEKKQRESSSPQSAKQLATHNECNSQRSSKLNVEDKIPQGIAASFPQDDAMIWIRNQQDRLNQLRLSNELGRDPLLLSRSASATIEHYIQEQALSQAIQSNLQHVGFNGLDNLRRMGLSSSLLSRASFDYPISKDNSIFPSQSLIGLTYHPLAVASSCPSSSYNRASSLPFAIGGGVTPSSALSSPYVIRSELENYLTQQSMRKFYG